MKAKNLQLILTGVFILFCRLLLANDVVDGYEIKVKIKDYDKDTLFLVCPMGNEFYVKDTAILDKSSGYFVFRGEAKLASGLYYLLLEKNTNLCELIISDKESQEFSVITQTKEPLKEIRLKNSAENDIFFDYVKFINKKTQEAETIKSQTVKDSTQLVQELRAIDNDVKVFQNNLFEKHKTAVTTTFIKSTIDVAVPNFENIKDAKERQLAQYYFYKNNYFNNTDLGNPCLLRTPTLFQKVNYYIENLTPQYPDSIIQSLDRILVAMEPSRETFQYYFLHYFNKYAKANIVGFDAITNHLSLNYIAKGKTRFISFADSTRLVSNAKKLAPLLIGKKAPNLTTVDANDKPVSLYDIPNNYTILYFFAHDCGHCAKQSPHVAAYVKTAKAKNIDVKIITICSNPIDEKQKCWDNIKEKGLQDALNTVDPYALRQSLYDVFMTPKIFILDKNKIIRSKDINGEQLEEVMDALIEEDNLKLKKAVEKR
jgi:peroxiredoxin